MRSFTYLVLGTFLTYSLQSPMARADRAPSTKEVLKDTLDIAADSKLQLVDEQGKALDFTDFVNKAPSHFSLISEDVKLEIKLKPINEGIGYSMAASSVASGKTLSRRHFTIDPKEKDASAAKIRFKQTALSMATEMNLRLEPKQAKTDWLSKIKLALNSTLGIPSAHANDSFGKHVTLSIITIVGLLVACAGVEALLKAGLKTGAENRQLLIGGGIALTLVTAIGIIGTIVVGVFSDELIRLVRAIKE